MRTNGAKNWIHWLCLAVLAWSGAVPAHSLVICIQPNGVFAFEPAAAEGQCADCDTDSPCGARCCPIPGADDAVRSVADCECRDVAVPGGTGGPYLVLDVASSGLRFDVVRCVPASITLWIPPALPTSEAVFRPPPDSVALLRMLRSIVLRI